MDVIGRCTSNRMLPVIITMKTLGYQKWILSSVYASTSAFDRRHGWDETRSVNSINEAPVVAGDFNCLFRAEDKQGGRQVCAGQLEELHSFVNDCDLFPLDDENYRFSLSNKRSGEGHIVEKTDRVFVNEKLQNMFLNARVNYLPNLKSDLRPILWDLDLHLSSNVYPFRFKSFSL